MREAPATSSSGRSTSARRAGMSSRRGSEYAQRTKLSSAPGVRSWWLAWNAFRYCCRSASVRVSAIWTMCRISGVQRWRLSTNWRRVSEPAGWGWNLCSWACCTGRLYYRPCAPSHAGCATPAPFAAPAPRSLPAPASAPHASPDPAPGGHWGDAARAHGAGAAPSAARRGRAAAPLPRRPDRQPRSGVHRRRLRRPAPASALCGPDAARREREGVPVPRGPLDAERRQAGVYLHPARRAHLLGRYPAHRR